MAQVQALGGVWSFTHPSPPPSSPETNDFAISSIGDGEPWGPGPGRGGSKGGLLQLPGHKPGLHLGSGQGACRLGSRISSHEQM